MRSRALITVGAAGVERARSWANPTLLADVYARVGGPGVDPETGLGDAVAASAMMEVNASHVVLDNVWLWRADVQNGKRRRDCNHSLVVNGANVTAYGPPCRNPAIQKGTAVLEYLSRYGIR